ncbi:hypothetical protein [Mucilaginibacter pedocola]|nr:hypothetical protein [Mucilaginibacter pedocola]
MKHLFAAAIILCLLSSCARVMNERLTTVTIRTTKPSKIVVNKDTLSTRKNKVSIKTPRSAEPLTVVAISDNSSRTVTIPAKNSFAWYYNIVTNFGIGMLIDKNAPQRYTYPNIYIDPLDVMNDFYICGPTGHYGEFLLHLSLPHANQFVFKPDGEKLQSNGGFLGLSVGLDYYHTYSQFINLSASAVTDFVVPVPAPYDRFGGSYKTMSSMFVSLSNNHKIERFSFGYGLFYGQNKWRVNYLRDSSQTIDHSITKKHNVLGLVGTTYYQFGPSFNLGLIYRPSFIRFGTLQRFRYEHLISLDLAWKIKL